MRSPLIFFLFLAIPGIHYSQGFLWGKTTHDWSAIEDPKRNELVVDSGGNVFLSGSFTEYPIQLDNCMAWTIGSQDIYYGRLRNSSDCHWMHEHGSSGMEFCSDIDVDPSGCMLACGLANGTPGPPLRTAPEPHLDHAPMHPQDCSILKMDSLGNTIWGIILLGDVGCYGKGITCDNIGNVFTSGVFTTQVWFPWDTLFSYGGSYDGFLSKHDSAGNYQWSLKVGGSGNEYDLFTATDGTANIAVTGNYTGTFYFDANDSLNPAGSGRDGFVGVYNQAGQFQYGLALGGPGDQMPQSLSFGEDGALYVAGYFTDSMVVGPFVLSDSGTGYSSFLARILPNGNLDWLVNPAGTGRNYCWQTCSAKNQGVVMGGSFAGSLNMGSVSMTSAGLGDGYAITVDSNGIATSGFAIASAGDDGVYTLDRDPAGGITVGGSYNGTLIAGNDTLISWLDDGFIIRYCPATQIDILEISDSQFCTGSTLNLSWDANGCFDTGNQFLFELSDSNGNFSSPLQLGLSDGIYAGSPMNLVIPGNVPPGNGYRIRIRSTLPAFTGNDNGNDIQIRSGSPMPVSISGDTIICPAGTFITLSATAGFSAYQWSTGDTLDSISISQPGSYWVSVRDSLGCTNSAGVNVQVCVSTQPSLSPAEFTLFPNPAAGFTRIHCNQSGAFRASIFNAAGSLIQEIQGETEMDIDLSSLSPGMYFIRATKEEQSEILKLLKLAN